MRFQTATIGTWRPAGDQGADYQKGCTYARQALAAAAAASNDFDRGLIASVLRSMVKNGRFEWLEHGFVSELAEAAAAPRAAQRLPLAKARCATNSAVDEAVLGLEGIVAALLIVARGNGGAQPTSPHPTVAAALRELVETLGDRTAHLRQAIERDIEWDRVAGSAVVPQRNSAEPRQGVTS